MKGPVPFAGLTGLCVAAAAAAGQSSIPSDDVESNMDAPSDPQIATDEARSASPEPAPASPPGPPPFGEGRGDHESTPQTPAVASDKPRGLTAAEMATVRRLIDLMARSEEDCEGLEESIRALVDQLGEGRQELRQHRQRLCRIRDGEQPMTQDNLPSNTSGSLSSASQPNQADIHAIPFPSLTAPTLASAPAPLSGGEDDPSRPPECTAAPLQQQQEGQELDRGDNGDTNDGRERDASGGSVMPAVGTVQRLESNALQLSETLTRLRVLLDGLPNSSDVLSGCLGGDGDGEQKAGDDTKDRD